MAASSDSKHPRNKPRPIRVWLRRADQTVVAICVLAGLTTMGGYWAYRGLSQRRLIDIEQAAPLEAQFQVDINSAKWPEFSQLPGIGETLARRIVDERKSKGVFVDHADLEQRVRGIGPLTMDRLDPYLLPMPPGANMAGSDSTELENGGS